MSFRTKREVQFNRFIIKRNKTKFSTNFH